MNRTLIVIAVLLVLAGGGYYLSTRQNDPTVNDISVDEIGSLSTSPTGSPKTTVIDQKPSDEEAELTGFAFMQDVVSGALEDAYDALSTNAQVDVSENVDDLLAFIEVEEAPDQGVSVENLIVEEGSAELFVGLNYSEGDRELRKITLIVEDGKWKVDSIEVTEERYKD